MVVAEFRDALVGSETSEAVNTGNDRFGSVGLDDLPVFVEFCFEIADDFGVGGWFSLRRSDMDEVHALHGGGGGENGNGVVTRGGSKEVVGRMQ